VDRILEEFSRRYWECNPGGVYGSASKVIRLVYPSHITNTTIDVVHAVSYSLLLLNTDLHVAELTTRMSRNQFVRNTLTAIQMQFQPTPPAQISTSDLTYDDCSSSIRGSEGTETVTRSHRSNSIASRTSVSREAVSLHITPETIHAARDPNGSTPSVQVSAAYEQRPSLNPVYGRAWESDMENLLKVCSHVWPPTHVLNSFPVRKCTMRSRVNRFCSH
jgi:PH and SEC7 domain-containing protein